MRRRAARLSAAALAVLVSFCATLAGAALLGLLVPRAPAERFAGEPRHTVWIAASPIHTDILLPATPDILRRFAFLGRDGLPLDHPSLRTIIVGWGGRTFYTQTPQWSDLAFDAVWRSATVDRSVLHVALGSAVQPGPGLREVRLSDAALDHLLGFVEGSFERGADGSPEVLAGTGYGAFDRFYEARGRFNLLFGCNTWTASALRAAGMPTAIWTPLPPTLLWGLDLHASP